MVLYASLLVLIGMTFVAITGITQGFLTKQKLASPGQILIFQMSLCTVILVAGLLWWDVDTPTTANAKVFWIAVIGTTLAGILFQLGTVKSRTADVSLTAPLLVLSPGIVTASVILLGEVPTTQGFIGIGLMIFGAWILGCKEVPLKKDGGKNTVRDYVRHYFLPFKMIVMPANADEKTRQQVIGVRWAYLVAVPGSTVGLFFDGLLPRNGNFLLGHSIQFGALALFFLSTRYRELWFKPPSDVPVETRKKRWILYVIGAVYGLHVFFIATAFKYAPMAYVGSMKRIQVIMLILLAWWLLKEKQAKDRLIPGAIVTVGAVLLAFDPSVEVILDAGQSFFVKLLQ